MPWQYVVSTGEVSYNGEVMGTGYSGHGEGVNQPADESIPNVGPVPAGGYTIGPPRTPIDHLGPIAMPLTPDPTNQMHGRFGFFIHGDTPAMNHTASDGCIILNHDLRLQIAAARDRRLVVLSEPAVSERVAEASQSTPQGD